MTRWQTAIRDKAYLPIRNLKLVESRAEDFREVLQAGTVATNLFLRKLHNFALNMNWLLGPVLVKAQWPKVRFKDKRGITSEEHERILAAERNPEWRAYYELLWHLAGSQSDMAALCAEDIDFDQLPDWRSRFFEYVPEKESFVWEPDAGLHGGAMRCQFEKGQVSAGSLKVIFGQNPFGRGVRRDETFREIYWRVYVKHEPGWEGNPAKLARATCLAGRDWSQGLIAHVWGGKGDALCIDPATGIREGRKVTTAYNDFPNLKWLGSRQGQTPIFSPAESGRWVCVESHVKLNGLGARDGVFELWIDGKLEAARTDLDWHGAWGDYAINAVFLENYWNQGSVKRQARWFDNFVISTKPIGPITASKPTILRRTESAGASAWEVEVATDPDGKDIVWTSKTVEASSVSLTVAGAHGAFTGSCAGKGSLDAGATHWVRVREVGKPDWSP